MDDHKPDDSWAMLEHWDDVSAGLRMFLVYVIITVSFTVLSLVVTIAIASSGGYSALKSLATFAKIAGVIGIFISAYGLFAIASYGRIAPQTGARGTAQAALVLGMISLVIASISIIGMMGKRDIEDMASNNLWDILARLLGVIQMFCLLSSFRTTAGYIGRLDLHGLAGTTMLLLGVTVGLVVMSQLMGMSRSVALIAVLGLAVLGIGIWCLVYVIMLVVRLSRAVTRDAHLPQTFA